jgi:AcrR family transcriptional regulator
MQEKSSRRSNQDRTESTRAQLIAAACSLFAEKGYAGTGTPDIAEAANVTRGALYHHFEDKEALLRAVVEREAALVAEQVERETADASSPIEALLSGGRTYLSAMADPGRSRLMLLDGPAALGRSEVDRIDALHGARTLREGLQHAINAGALKNLPLDALTTILSSAFDRAALSIAMGASEDEQMEVLAALLEGLKAKPDDLGHAH